MRGKVLYSVDHFRAAIEAQRVPTRSTSSSWTLAPQRATHSCPTISVFVPRMTHDKTDTTPGEPTSLPTRSGTKRVRGLLTKPRSLPPNPGGNRDIIGDFQAKSLWSRFRSRGLCQFCHVSFQTPRMRTWKVTQPAKAQGFVKPSGTGKRGFVIRVFMGGACGERPARKG